MENERNWKEIKFLKTSMFSKRKYYLMILDKAIKGTQWLNQRGLREGKRIIVKKAEL